jgi:hypothetical protein
MPGPDVLTAGLFAYGPAPGVELIPYFLGLLAWAGLAILAIALAPIKAAIRRLRGKPAAPATVNVPETPPTANGDVQRDGP